MTQPLHFAMVCASNMNRSMEAHLVLQRAGLKVDSFGVGGHVKLPGPSQREPNIYAFGTPYTKIYADLVSKDSELPGLNPEVRDSHEDAAVAAPQALKLCQMLGSVPMWEDAVDDIIKRFEAETGQTAIYTICFV
ncbi:MAG: hypothetical protein WDW38_010784 [Sanguina aurantia]